MKKLVALLLVLLAGFAVFGAAKPKYVFLIIGDGMSTPQRMAADEFARTNGLGEVAMNRLPYQCFTRTRCAESLVTDSAAAATAIACGEKTTSETLGMAPDGRRLESVAEFAKKQGMKVGIMTTVAIVHATPAGFYAHRKSRGEYYRIGLDLVDSGFDFFAGGGMFLKENATDDAEYRGNVFELAKNAGYTIIDDRQRFLDLKPGSGKVLGMFSGGHLDFAIDYRGRQPTLAEIVRKATECLEGPDGFFLMAEGGTIDYSAHANDAASVVREVLSMDEAVKVALEFYRRHPNETLIVVTGDHETGGMSLGNSYCGYRLFPQLLARQKMSSEVYSSMIGSEIKKNPDMTFEDVKASVTENFGFLFKKEDAVTDDDKRMLLSPAEQKNLQEAFADDVAFVTGGKKETTAHDVKRRRRFANTLKRLMSDHTGIGWSTSSHTAFPTQTSSIGVGAECFVGFIDNTELSKKLRELMSR